MKADFEDNEPEKITSAIEVINHVIGCMNIEIDLNYEDWTKKEQEENLRFYDSLITSRRFLSILKYDWYKKTQY